MMPCNKETRLDQRCASSKAALRQEAVQKPFGIFGSEGALEWIFKAHMGLLPEQPVHQRCLVELACARHGHHAEGGGKAFQGFGEIVDGQGESSNCMNQGRTN